MNSIASQQDYNMICKAAAICDLGTKEILTAFCIFKENFLFALRASGKQVLEKTREAYIRKAFSLIIIRGGDIDEDDINYWTKAQWKTYLNTANDNVVNFLYDHYRAQEKNKDQAFKRNWSSIPPACFTKDLFYVSTEDWRSSAAVHADLAIDAKFIEMIVDKNPKDFFDRRNFIAPTKSEPVPIKTETEATSLSTVTI